MVFQLQQNHLVGKPYKEGAAHSMNRFVRALKKINKNDDVHHFACYCFSFLLNSTDLNIMSRYFRLICLVFLTPFTNSHVEDAVSKLNQ